MAEAMCCPLQGADECATVYNRRARVARKDHACFECEKTIPRGSKYEYVSMLFDGHWDDFKTCLPCSEIGDHFTCYEDGVGRIVGQLWSDLQENFFPDMKAGGPCMEGLSPAAKQKLIDERMEWYFEQDEIDDGAWEDYVTKKDPQ